MNFESQEEYDAYAKSHGRPHSAHRIILCDPDGQGTSSLPADGLKHYLDIGFRWPSPPVQEPAPEPEPAPKPEPAPEPKRGATKRRRSR